MRVLIATAQVPFVTGGAEMHAAALRRALIASGAEAEIVAIPFKWYPPERMLEQMLACRLLDLSEVNGQRVDRVIALRFPAYFIPHDNKVVWLLHQHRPAYDLWDSGASDMLHATEGEMVRRAIHAADCRLLPEARRIFANSNTVAARLRHYSNLESTPLYHPPPDHDRLAPGGDDRYIYFPSRIDGMKRQDLALRALAHTAPSVRVVFSGAPSNERDMTRLHQRAADLGVAGRVTWRGHVTDAERRGLYANCTAVLYPPIDEDYGYVTLEAMLCAKPVITCTDSGGPLEFVEHDRSGLIAAPSPEALGAALDRIWTNPTLAHTIGAQARADLLARDITWPRVTEILLDAY